MPQTQTPTTYHGKQLVGPFGGNPVNGPGLYAVKSPKSDDLVLSHWNGSYWSKYASSPKRASERAGSRSRQLRNPQWYGFAR